jgi:hypothetical protein
MPIRSRPAPSSSAPWRTAPGLGSDGAAAPISRTSGTVVDERTGPESHHDDGAVRAPTPALFRSPPHRAHEYEPAASAPGPAAVGDLDGDAPAHGQKVEQSSSPEQPHSGDGTGTHHDGAGYGKEAAEPAGALARPQVRLDADLPREQVVPPRRGRATAADSVVTRYTAAQDSFSRSVRSLEPISDLEAASFAGRFATDFQSFDEDDPSRRAEVLRPLLAAPQACTWGWSGAGRQRADAPLPGRLYRPGDTVVFVEVIVRVTTYARACPPPEAPRHAGSAEVELSGLLGPSCAPPEADPAWTAVEANWVRMTVPITRDDDGHLVVDPYLRPTDSS